MGKITFSDDQKSIIKSRNENILVSAAAGSGKTAVLVERIIRRVTDPVNPVDIDRILVVTFTKAAAKEMKDRISRAITDKMDEWSQDPSKAEALKNLERQTTLIHNAKITTIDSFCLDVLKNNFHKIGMDPSFRAADDNEKKLIMADVVSQVISDAYESKDEAFYRLADCYSKKDSDETIAKSILSLYGFAMSYPWPEKWLNERKMDYHFESLKEFSTSNMVNEQFDFAQKQLEKALSLQKKAWNLYLTEITGTPEEPKDAYGKALLADERLINALLSGLASDRESVNKLFDGNYKRLAKADKLSEELKKTLKLMREEYKEIIDDLFDGILACPLERHYENCLLADKTVPKLVDMTLDFMQRFDEAKRERNVIDFSDMSHYAIKILISDYIDEEHYEITDVARDYRDFFEEVMIDEYQDSNLVQEIILRSISREDTQRPGNRFVVGDIKQSIYRFRLARPEIFAKKRAIYQKERDRSLVVDLSQNFRSRKGVIDSANAVFTRIMTKELGGETYDEKSKLHVGADYKEEIADPRTRVILVDQKGRKADNLEYEARAIADEIRRIKKEEMVTDKKTERLRPAEYKDIAILFGSLDAWAPTIREVFDKYGIPYHVEKSGAFYDTREVLDVINFLRVVNNPFDDISLFGAMKSFFGEFTDEECAKISVCDDKDAFFLWEKVKACYKESEENSKINKFVNLVEEYRELVTYTPIGELISKLITDTGYELYVAAKADGEQRLANVRLLNLKAIEYAKTSFHGLFHFLRYVELIKETEDKEGEAGIIGEESDAVRIMTIHKSKGLEFPICVVGGMESKFKESETSNPFIFDIDLGIGAAAINSKRRVKHKTLRQLSIIDKINRDSLSERVRVLYVAMTRAKEKLILVGMFEDSASYLSSFNGKYACNMDFCVPAILEEPQLFDVVYERNEEIMVNETEDEASIREKRDSLKLSLSDDEKDLLNRLGDKFEFEYGHKELTGLYVKTTVSELKMAAMEEVQGETEHMFKEREREEYVPKFAGREETIKGTDRGTAYHKILCLLDYTRPLDKEDFDEQLRELLEQQKLQKREIDMVPKGKILTFLESRLCERMKKAAAEKKLSKEQPFVLGVSADKVNKEFSKDEIMLVQGVIDVFFEEDGKLVLMDYKTDKVDNAEQLSERYATQLDYYSEALKRLTGLEVSEKLIYSFGLNATIVVK